MATFFNPMPLDGAHYIENPAKVFVGRVARAVQYDQKLYNAYKDYSFFKDPKNLQNAIAAALKFRGPKGDKNSTARLIRAAKAAAAKKLGGRKDKAAFNAEVDRLLAGKVDRAALQSASKRPLAQGFRVALAAAMGRYTGYEKAIERNRSRYLDVYGTQTGISPMQRGDEIMLGRNKAFKIRKGVSSQLKGKSFKGALAASRGNEKLLQMKGLRPLGAGSLNAAKAAALADLRRLSVKNADGTVTPWWEADTDEYEKFRTTGKAARKAANQAEFRAKASSTVQGDELADVLSGRFAEQQRLLSEVYRPLGLVKGSGAGQAQTKGAGKSTYRNKITGKTAVLTANQASKTQYKNYEPIASNPFGDLSDDEMGYNSLALSNPTGIGFLDSAENMVDGVPLVGPVLAPIVAPAALGAAAAAVHILVVPRIEGYLPSWAQPYSYSIGGAAVGIVSGLVASRTTDSTTRTAAGLIGGAAVAIGLGIDAYRLFIAKGEGGATAGDDMGSLALSGEDDMGSLALSGDDMGSLALSGDMGSIALGDGGAFQIQNLGYHGDHSALSSMYGDASMADAYFSGPDLDGVEGEAALAGASTFMGTFGAAPVRAAGQRRIQSRHAGLRGHRWGWLIKMVGFDNFQKIVALSPEQRVSVIKQLREQAMASVQRFVDESKAAQLASQPVTAPAALGHGGATAGYDLSGYGATLFSGNGY